MFLLHFSHITVWISVIFLLLVLLKAPAKRIKKLANAGGQQTKKATVAA